MAAFLVFLCVVAVPALADEDGPAANVLAGAEEVPDPGSLIDTNAAEEMPLLNLDRENASELVEIVFGPVLANAAGTFDDLEVDHYLADNVAVVNRPESEESETAPSEDSAEETRVVPQLVDSTLPLRTEDDQGQIRQVDLGLEHTEGQLQPANPLVDVGIPSNLGEGIELPETGISIGLDEAPSQVAPTILGDTVAFYPNVSEDTDLAVTPTPTGVETLTTLRGPQSPTTQTYNLGLPKGAELRLLGKGAGGAEIVAGEERLVQIPPPTAIDATGAPVRAVLGVSAENELTVNVDPTDDPAYPVLVDPLFQAYEWKTKNSSTGINFTAQQEEWRPDERNKIIYFGPNSREWYLDDHTTNYNYPIVPDWHGLYVHGHGELQSGERLGFMYSVPRYYSDQKTYGTKPESYISRMDLSNVVWKAESSGNSPYVLMGLYDPANGFVSYYKHEGLTGHSVTDMAFTYPFENKTGNSSVKTATVGLESYETVSAMNALFVGSASVQLTEPSGNLPGLTVKGTAPWVNKTPAPVEFTASDSGLGVYSVTATAEKNQEIFWKAKYGCTGVPGNACPRTWKSTDAGHPGPIYNPAALPEGESFLKIVAEDPLGQKSEPAYALVKIDQTYPSLELRGTITEQGSLGTSRPNYELEINSSDGTVEQPQSGVARTAIEVDGKVVDESAPGCATQNCAVSRKWMLDASQYASGSHMLKVVSTDAVGNTITKSQSFKLQPAAPPTVEVSGSATQQATLGTSRPRYLLSMNASTSAGFNGTPMAPPVYVSTVGATGTGKGQFLGARGTAVDSKGNLWVVDWEGGRVEQLSAKGEYLGQFGEPGSNPGQLKSPTAVAIDAAGNFWVACGDGRIEEFSSAGKFVKQFGKYGKEDGEFESPTDIAIDAKGNLWILDNNRVQELSQEGKFLGKFGTQGNGSGQFAQASGLAIGPDGNIWVADTGNDRLQKFNPEGKFLASYAEPGSGNGNLSKPDGIRIDQAGNVYVADGANGRVQVFNAAGEYLTQFGSAGNGPGQFEFPSNLSIDPAGSIWVDAGSDKIQRWRLQLSPPTYSFSFGSRGALGVKAEGALSLSTEILKMKATFSCESATAENTLIEAEGKGSGKFLLGGCRTLLNGVVSAECEPKSPTGGAGTISTKALKSQFTANEGSTLVRVQPLEGETFATIALPVNCPIGTSVPVLGSFYAKDSSGKLEVEKMTHLLEAGPSTQLWAISKTIEHKATATGALGIGLGGEHLGDLWSGSGAEPSWRIRSSSELPAGAGQLSVPTSSAVNSAGKVFVVDRANGRIQKFGESGEYLSQFASKGSLGGQLSNPYGVAIDPSGNVWVSDTANARVVKFNGSGEFLSTFGTNVNKTKVEAGGTQAEKNLCTAVSKNVCQAGTAGSLEGQMKQPTGLAISSGGNLYVVEKGNGRVEKFSPSGELLAKFGGPGSGTGQFVEPTGIALAPDGTLWVADSGNNRIQQWSSTFDPLKSIGEKGTANGQFSEPFGVATDAKGNVWVADTGANRVQEFASNGDFVGKFGKSGTGEGLLSTPDSVAVDAGGSLWVTDTGHNQIQKWLPPSSKASTIATEISIDGSLVSAKTSRCGTEACAISPEWTLDSGSYAVGKHTIQVKATDGLGRSTTKTLAVELQKDTTKPTLETTGALVTAPEGWVEQQNYNLSATATDAGYGLNSLVAKIDGKEVASWANACPDGGCKATISKAVDMRAYAGGSHPAEVIATDGAGNMTTKAWTINVDPAGQVSTEEAADTLEALEGTTAANPIGPSKAEAQYYGSSPGLGLVQNGNEIVATGSQVPTVIANDPAEGVEMQILPDNAFAGACQSETSSPEEDAEIGESEGEPEMAKPKATCERKEEDESAFELEGITVIPTAVSSAASPSNVVDGQAAVASNIVNNVDSATRPLYEGVLTFQDIRDATASEVFTWEVSLTDGQELKLLDPQHAAVYYKGGHLAFGIQAEPAHDAVGASVPTKLEVSGNDLLTLRVEHHAGSSFVYPILSGMGWQGGFETTSVQGPKDEQELKEELERIMQEEREAREEEEAGEIVSTVVNESGTGLDVNIALIGPPVADPNALDNPEPNKGKVFTFAHKFKFNDCRYDKEGEIPVPPSLPDRREAIKKCQREISGGNAPKLIAGTVVHGWFHDNQQTEWVWIAKGNLHCDKWGSQQPAMVHCEKRPLSPTHTQLHLYGDYRYAPKNGNFFGDVAACVTVRGRLEVGPTFHQEETVLTPATIVEPCSWP